MTFAYDQGGEFRLMATRQQVRELVDAGLSYEDVADALGIDPGLAFMIGTGLPADASDNLNRYNTWRPGYPAGSTQHLANPAESTSPTQNQTVIDWIKRRARNDAQMLEAAAHRSADPGEIKDPDNVSDVHTVLTRDHDQVTALLAQLSAIPGHKQGGSKAHVRRRESIVDMVADRLAEHESAEQQCLWPAVREALPDGERWAEEGRQQEREVTETLNALRNADADSDEFDELVEKLVMQCRQHVAFEDRLFLQLAAAMSTNGRRTLGRKVERAKKLAPRPTDRKGSDG